MQRQVGDALMGRVFGPFLRLSVITYTRKNAQVATDLQTSCNKSVRKLFTRCIRTACSEFVGTSLEQAVDKL